MDSDFSFLNKDQASLVAETVKNLPTLRETWVHSLGWKREWLSVPVFLPGKIHGDRAAWRATEQESQELDMTERLTHAHTHTPIPTQQRPVLPGRKVHQEHHLN